MKYGIIVHEIQKKQAEIKQENEMLNKRKQMAIEKFNEEMEKAAKDQEFIYGRNINSEAEKVVSERNFREANEEAIKKFDERMKNEFDSKIEKNNKEIQSRDESLKLIEDLKENDKKPKELDKKIANLNEKRVGLDEKIEKLKSEKEKYASSSSKLKAFHQDYYEDKDGKVKQVLDENYNPQVEIDLQKQIEELEKQREGFDKEEENINMEKESSSNFAKETREKITKLSPEAEEGFQKNETYPNLKVQLEVMEENFGKDDYNYAEYDELAREVQSLEDELNKYEEPEKDSDKISKDEAITKLKSGKYTPEERDELRKIVLGEQEKTEPKALKNNQGQEQNSSIRTNPEEPIGGVNLKVQQPVMQGRGQQGQSSSNPNLSKEATNNNLGQSPITKEMIINQVRKGAGIISEQIKRKDGTEDKKVTLVGKTITIDAGYGDIRLDDVQIEGIKNSKLDKDKNVKEQFEKIDEYCKKNTRADKNVFYGIMIYNSRLENELDKMILQNPNQKDLVNQVRAEMLSEMVKTYNSYKQSTEKNEKSPDFNVEYDVRRTSNRELNKEELKDLKERAFNSRNFANNRAGIFTKVNWFFRDKVEKLSKQNKLPKVQPKKALTEGNKENKKDAQEKQAEQLRENQAQKRRFSERLQQGVKNIKTPEQKAKDEAKANTILDESKKETAQSVKQVMEKDKQNNVSRQEAIDRLKTGKYTKEEKDDLIKTINEKDDEKQER